VFRNILAPVDGSSHARRALSEAADLARDGRAQLTVLTVVPDLSAWVTASAGAAAESIEILEREIEREYESALDAATADLPRPSRSPERGRGDRSRARAALQAGTAVREP